MPDLPTIGKSVAGYDITTWYGIGAPRGTPAEIIDKLNRAINAGLADPELTARLPNWGDSPHAHDTSEFGKLVAPKPKVDQGREVRRHRVTVI